MKKNIMVTVEGAENNYEMINAMADAMATALVDSKKEEVSYANVAIGAANIIMRAIQDVVKERTGEDIGFPC